MDTAPGPPRVYTLTDLPLDCLSLIISKVKGAKRSGPMWDCAARFRAPPLVCKVMAQAAARPSVAWEDMLFHSRRSADANASFLDAMRRMAPAVRRLTLSGWWEDNEQTPFPDLLSALAALAPHLQSLRLMKVGDAALHALAAQPDILHAAARLEELRVYGLRFTGPPGMLAAASPALVARAADEFRRSGHHWASTWTFDWCDNSPPFLYHTDILDASAAAGRPVRLASLFGADLSIPPGPRVGPARESAPNLIAAMGADVTDLGVFFAPAVDYGDEGEVDEDILDAAVSAVAARVARTLNRLPGVRDLALRFTCPEGLLDLRALEGRHIRRLHLESISDTWEKPKVTLSPTLAASVEDLTCVPGDGYPFLPPLCLRGEGGAAFARLTRLEYGGDSPGPVPFTRHGASNLAPWGDDYRLPALRVLTVWGRDGFTLVDGSGYDQQVGPGASTWAARTLANLPRLQRLTLVRGLYRAIYGIDDAPLFSCRPLFVGCPRCRRSRACAGAAPAREAVMHDLPTAVAGRRVVVDVVDDADMPGGAPFFRDDPTGGLGYVAARQ